MIANVEMRFVKVEVSRPSPFGPNYKTYYKEKQLQYRYYYGDTYMGLRWSPWIVVPCLESEEAYASASDQ